MPQNRMARSGAVAGRGIFETPGSSSATSLLPQTVKTTMMRAAQSEAKATMTTKIPLAPPGDATPPGSTDRHFFAHTVRGRRAWQPEGVGQVRPGAGGRTQSLARRLRASGGNIDAARIVV